MELDDRVELAAEVLKERCPLCNHTPRRCPGHDLEAAAVVRALNEKYLISDRSDIDPDYGP